MPIAVAPTRPPRETGAPARRTGGRGEPGTGRPEAHAVPAPVAPPLPRRSGPDFDVGLAGTDLDYAPALPSCRSCIRISSTCAAIAPSSAQNMSHCVSQISPCVAR